MKECGIAPIQLASPKAITPSKRGRRDGQAAGIERIPTAVLCSNDMTAIGVLHKLYRTGLRVPDDVSVIGFDDIHIAEVTTPR